MSSDALYPANEADAALLRALQQVAGLDVGLGLGVDRRDRRVGRAHERRRQGLLVDRGRGQGGQLAHRALGQAGGFALDVGVGVQPALDGILHGAGLSEHRRLKFGKVHDLVPAAGGGEGEGREATGVTTWRQITAKIAATNATSDASWVPVSLSPNSLPRASAACRAPRMSAGSDLIQAMTRMISP